MRRPFRCRQILLLAAGCAWLPVIAGGPDAVDFDAEKAHYEAKRDAALRSLREGYHRKLLPLEKKLSEQRDFGQAQRVKTERESVAAKIGAKADYHTMKKGALDRATGVVTLEPAAAEVSGGVVLETGGTLSGWTQASGIARWALPPGMAAGGYVIRLLMSCEPGSGGKVMFRESLHTLTRDVEPPTGSGNFVSQDFGPLRIRGNGSQSFEISAVSVKGAGLFRVKSILLIPPGADADAAANKANLTPESAVPAEQ